MKYLISIILLLSLAISYSQNLSRSVMGSGAVTSSSEGVRLQATVGQAVIGVSDENSVVNKAGFWHRARKQMEQTGGATLVVLPELEGKIGDILTVPLLLQDSEKFEGRGRVNFEAKIRYNKTVVMPMGYSGDCDTEDCIITVNGDFSGSQGVLANIDFKLLLGNAESTDLEIISFKWIVNDYIEVLTKNGKISILDICREGDELRLIKHGETLQLFQNYPNPARDFTTIEYELNETGLTKMYLIDLSGNVRSTFFEQEMQVGRYEYIADVSDYPSGYYFIVLQTPNQIFSISLIIEK